MSNSFSKSGYESFSIQFDFSTNFVSSEAISTLTVLVLNAKSAEVTPFIVGASSVVGGNKVIIRIMGGISSQAPYTFRVRVETNKQNKWEMFAKMEICAD